MTRTLISTFDSVATADTPCGSVLALDNGTVAFVPTLPLAFGLNDSAAMTMLDASLAPRGLSWGAVEFGPTTRQAYVSRLEKPTAEKQGPTVQTPSGSVRLARTPEQVAALSEVAAAFKAGDLSALLTPDALALEAKERAKADKRAAKAVNDAKEFAHPNWPKAAFGMSVTDTAQALVLQFNYDAAVVKAVKASKAVWSASRKTWTLPHEQAVAFGKRFLKIARELGKDSGDKSVSLDEQARQREAELLAREKDSPLAGTVGTLTIGLRHFPYALPGRQHQYTLRFPYHQAMIGLVRGVPGAQFNPLDKQWEVPLIARESLLHKMQYLRPYALESERSALAAPAEAERVTAERASAKAAARHAERSAETSREGRWYVHPFGTRDGGGLPTGIYQSGAEWNVVLERSRGRYVEDASSLGGSMDCEYQYRLTVRAATPQEIELALADRAAAAAKGQEARARDAAFALLDAAFRLAEYPEQAVVPHDGPSTLRGYLINVNGRAHWMTGQATRFVVDAAAGKLWRVQENGLDGDDWSRNNYNRCVASCLPLTGADKVLEFLEEARAPLASPAPALTADDVDGWAIPAQQLVLREQAPVHAAQMLIKGANLRASVQTTDREVLLDCGDSLLTGWVARLLRTEGVDAGLRWTGPQTSPTACVLVPRYREAGADVDPMHVLAVASKAIGRLLHGDERAIEPMLQTIAPELPRK